MTKDGDLFLAELKTYRKYANYLKALRMPLYNPDDYGRIYN